MSTPDFDNEDFNLAYRMVEHTHHTLFLTGAAGTGKTTFLRRLQEISHKRIVVAAPTGIAAINAGGVTLHSLFQLDFGPFVPGTVRKDAHRFSKEKLRLICSIDVLVIDEISMVRADLLDAVDDALRRLRDGRKPFGGVQLLLIGDLYQLPPVVKDEEWQLLQRYYHTAYFFSSRALSLTPFLTLELNKVYRQSDPQFLNLLHAIRTGKASADILSALNSRCIPGFTPSDGRHWVRLTTHNATADAINRRQMEALKGDAICYDASIDGKFPDNVLPAEKSLALKKGAQVMFIRNDSSGQRRYYNGMLGIVTALDNNAVWVRPEGTGMPMEVKKESWENRRYEIDDTTLEVKDHVDGVFTQIPLRAAWAITIHKSQGLTFDRAIIDTAAAFTSGQTYVALSRCRSMQGMVLSSPLRAESIITDPVVRDFIARSAANRPDSASMRRLEQEYLLTLLNDLFDFSQLAFELEELRRTVDMAFHNIFPSVVKAWDEATESMTAKIRNVADTFRRQYTPLLQSVILTDNSDPVITALKERIKAAAGYFRTRLEELNAILNDTPGEHDNKQIQKRLRNHTESFRELLQIKLHLMKSMTLSDFNAPTFLKKRAEAASLPTTKTLKTGKTSPKTASLSTEDTEAAKNTGIFAALKAWRLKEAKEQGLPAFRIIGTKALLNIAAARPKNVDQLLSIKFIGPAIAKTYGPAILKIVAQTSTDPTPR